MLICAGRLNDKEMRKNKLDFEQLMMLLRQQNIFTIREVAYAIFESNGSLSIMKKPEYEQPTRGELEGKADPAKLPVTLVEAGDIQEEGLRSLQRDEHWLHEQLRENGYSSLKRIAYAEWLDGDGIYIMEK